MPRPMSTERRAALESGAKFYKGPRCKFGHDAERYTSTNACRECVRRQTRPDRPPKRRNRNEFEALL